VGEGDDGSAGVTAIRGAEGVRGGEGEGDDGVRLIALMTDARGDEVGAGVGRASLNGEGDPKGDSDAPFATTGLPLLLLSSPSAMSTRGHRCGASRAASSTMDVGIVELRGCGARVGVW